MRWRPCAKRRRHGGALQSQRYVTPNERERNPGRWWVRDGQAAADDGRQPRRDFEEQREAFAANRRRVARRELVADAERHLHHQRGGEVDAEHVPDESRIDARAD
jgi:hypothetical protein